MIMREYDIEAMQEVLEQHGIEVSFDKAKEIAEDFIVCYQSNRECEAPVPCPNKESDFMRAERLQKELDILKRKYNKEMQENEVYNKYISKSLGVERVGIDNGRVYYDK